MFGKGHDDPIWVPAHTECRNAGGGPCARSLGEGSVLIAATGQITTPLEQGLTGVTFISGCHLCVVTLIDTSTSNALPFCSTTRSSAEHTHSFPPVTLLARPPRPPFASPDLPSPPNERSKCPHSLSRSPSSTLGDPTRAVLTVPGGQQRWYQHRAECGQQRRVDHVCAANAKRWDYGRRPPWPECVGGLERVDRYAPAKRCGRAGVGTDCACQTTVCASSKRPETMAVGCARPAAPM